MYWSHPVRQLFTHQAWIALAAGLVLFTNLGAPSLWDEDEPKNAQCAREMLARGDWIVPTFNGELRTDKPVLLYWLMFTAYQAFGINEFSARLWSAMFALGTSLATYHIGRRLIGPRAACWAGVIVASNMLFAVAGRAATPDSTLIFFTTLAMLLFVRGCWGEPPAVEFASPPCTAGVGGGVPQGDARPAVKIASPPFKGGVGGGAPQGDVRPAEIASPPWPAMTFVYLAMGLGVLAKGPVAIVLPGGVLGLYLLIRRYQISSAADAPASAPVEGKHLARRLYNSALSLARRAGRLLCLPSIAQMVRELRPLTAAAVLAAIALPWYVAVGMRTNGEWLAGFLGKHNVGRFMSPMEGHSGPFFYYVPAIAIGFFPWSAFLPLGITELIRRLRGPGNAKAAVFLACWAGLYVGFFSLSGTKLPSYVLPAYPALALITALFLDRLLSQPPVQSRAVLLAIGSVCLAGLVMSGGLAILAAARLPGETSLALVGLIPLIGGGLACLWYRREDARRAVLALGVTAVLLATATFGLAAVRVSSHQNSAAIAALIRTIEPDGARLATFDFNAPSLVFYTGGRVPQFYQPKDVGEFFAGLPSAHVRPEHDRREQGAGTFLVTHAKHLETLRAALPPGVEVIARQQRFLRRSELVLLGRTPRTARAGRPE